MGNSTIVERGLVKGENIVVEGYHKLTHGMKVNPIPAPLPVQEEDEDQNDNEAIPAETASGDKNDNKVSK